MLHLKLVRKYKKDSYTIGLFYVNGVFFSNSLEDKDRGLRKDMDIAQIRQLKVYGETAIPTGSYKVELTYSSKFCTKPWARITQGKVPEITHVPGYSGVRFHPLNCAKDSLGCIGLGKNDKKGWISNSTAAYTKLLTEYLLPAWKAGEDVYLTIE